MSDYLRTERLVRYLFLELSIKDIARDRIQTNIGVY